MTTPQDPEDLPPPYATPRDAEPLLRWALERFHPRIAIATSLQDAALIHMAVAIRPDVRVFSIDTGRLPEEAYQCAEAIRRQLGVKIEWYFPRHEAVEKLESEKGVYSFRESLENRRECCHIRKVEPLQRALAGLDAWITSLRRDESVTRQDLPPVERDEAHGGILKINPLLAWSADDVRAYLTRHRVPYNRLLDQGYPSIGCACCTRPVQPGEDPRAGRWWWENPEHKECGLHLRPRHNEANKP
jgi:phosphoadenosine phosphosulfate reductase